MKWLIRIALIVVVLVVVLAVGAVVFIDSIATKAVKEGAAFATQTDVELEGIDVKILGSTATITNLDIKNPDGELRTKFDSFMKLGNGSAGVSVASITSDLIEIPKVELSNIEMSLVGMDDGTKNYEMILQSLKRFQGDEPPKETQGQKEVVIRELIISNITVHYDFAKDPVLGAAPTSGTIMIADKEPMVLTDVGSGGVPMSQITADIITDILVQVMANMAGNIGGHMKGLANSLVDNIGAEQLGEALKALNLGDKISALGELGLDVGKLGIDAVEVIGDGAGDVVEGIGSGLRGLLGGDDEEEKPKEE